MTEQQGRGVRVLSQLVEDLSQHDREKARAIFDGLTDQQLADVFFAHAAAREATGDPGEFTLSVAARLDQGAEMPS